MLRPVSIFSHCEGIPGKMTGKGISFQPPLNQFLIGKHLFRRAEGFDPVIIEPVCSRLFRAGAECSDLLLDQSVFTIAGDHWQPCKGRIRFQIPFAQEHSE